MVTIFLLVFLCIGCILLLSWKSRSVKALLPPGPSPLPILGNFLQLDQENLLKSLTKVSEVYGPVFTVYLGLQRIVVLCGYEAVKEGLVDHAEAFGGRGQIPLLSSLLKEHGIVFSNGERWRQLRRFTLTTLRNFGMGKRSLEEKIKEEALCLVEELNKTEGDLFDPMLLLSRAVANIVCSILFGKRFEYSDGQFLRLKTLMTERQLTSNSPKTMLYNLFPEIMAKIPGMQWKMAKSGFKILDFIKEKIETELASFDASDPQNYIECFLVKMEQEKHNPNSEFSIKNLSASVMNLLIAGIDTTATTLRYGFLFLLKYPHVQEKVHKEIDHVVGQGRVPTLKDRSQMPYTEAVLNEIQRMADVVPMNLPHLVTQDTHFRGYVIPKGTYIYPMLNSVHYDKQHHANPEEFDPGRFLDSNGCLKKVEAFMPFSVGKRICIGEGLARMMLFLFFTTILQKFTLTSPVPPEKISIAPAVHGVTSMAQHYQLSVVPRQS
ncbi:cytochrome P450 2B4-like [Anolis sagrei]|uniref:cytochrome P450 2B4-like n=1 Tax=Anolis sagrei TaxID=38937 RepID=UPI003521B34F